MNWSTAKEMTEALKNIATLLFYAFLAIGLILIWPHIVNKDQQYEVKKLWPLEIGPKEKAAIKTIDAVPLNVPKQGNDTSKIPTKYVSAAKLIDTTLNQNNQNWVYLGQIVNGQLTNSHFQLKKLPRAGDVIKANDAVYKRKSLPEELKNGYWKLGEIRGVVADSESVMVTDVKEIADKNYWALVQ